MITKQSVVSLGPDIRYRVVDEDEGVVVRQEAGEILVVNKVGAYFLRLVDGSRSIENIAVDLEQIFDTDQKTLLDDLLTFTDSLIRAGVVSFNEVQNGPNPADPDKGP